MMARRTYPDWIDQPRTFVEFCRFELAGGGPDPQIEVAGRAARRMDTVPEAAWLAACFVAPYTLAGGATIHTAFPWSRVMEYSDPYELEADLEKFINENWEGIPVRRERRACWSRPKLAECLRSFAQWIDAKRSPNDPYHVLMFRGYDELFESVAGKHGIRYLGRYAAMKFCQTLWRGGVVNVQQDSIVPRGGWSPRRTLKIIFPDSPVVEKANNAAALADAHAAGERARLLLEANDVTVDYYQLETLLCIYRQVIDYGKYPGRWHDSQLGHWMKALAGHGGDESALASIPFFEIRENVFSFRLLGEKQGWAGPREDLESVFYEHCYLWTDLLYDYNRSTNRLDNPVRWGDVEDV